MITFGLRKEGRKEEEFIQYKAMGSYHNLTRNTAHPKEPEDVILLFSKGSSICIRRQSIAKQPKPKSAGKYVDVFLKM